MSCRSSAWCPECKQVITDSICMCAGVCDIHGQICTPVVPDGKHPVRATGKTLPHTDVEYLNGWETGFWTWSKEGGNWSVWMAREPGHPTKSPSDLMRDEWAEKSRVARIQWEGIFDVRSDGGGI